MTTGTTPAAPSSADGLTLHGVPLMNINDAAALLGVTALTVYNYRRAGIFPRPIHLGPKTLFWRRDEVEHFKVHKAELMAQAKAALR